MGRPSLQRLLWKASLRRFRAGRVAMGLKTHAGFSLPYVLGGLAPNTRIGTTLTHRLVAHQELRAVIEYQPWNNDAT